MHEPVFMTSVDPTLLPRLALSPTQWALPQRSVGSGPNMHIPPTSLLIRGLSALLVGTAPGCWLVQPSGCDAYLAATLSLTVKDATNGQEIRRPFTLTVISQTTGDSAVLDLPADIIQPFSVFQSDPEHRFTVDVKAEAYHSWRRADIEVSLDGCGRYKTRRLRASLVPR